jgi:hypothetical protein
MRLLIYLLAMLSGFSVAEAARPVISTPASVDSSVAQSYVATAALEADAAYERPQRNTRVVRAARTSAIGTATRVALAPDTPVHRHDVILR